MRTTEGLPQPANPSRHPAGIARAPLLVIALALLAAGAIAFRARARHPVAPPRAQVPAPNPQSAPKRSAGTGLIDRSQYVGPFGDALSETYFWISDSALLLLKHGVGSYFEAFRMDAVTGDEIPLRGFNSRFGRRLRGGVPMYVSYGPHGRTEKIYDPPTCCLSPDGKWLLWRVMRGDAWWDDWLAATLDGARAIRWEPADRPWFQSSALWCSDGRSWIEPLSQIHMGRRLQSTMISAVIHALDKPRDRRAVQISGVGEGSLMAADPRGRAMINRAHQARILRSATLGEIDLSGLRAGGRTFRIRLPRKAEIEALELSPRGDRLGWILSDGGDPEKRPVAYSLWVSGRHGEQMRCLGSVNGFARQSPSLVADSEYFFPTNLRWTPDCRRLSFVFDHAIWTLPIAERAS